MVLPSYYAYLQVYGLEIITMSMVAQPAWTCYRQKKRVQLGVHIEATGNDLILLLPVYHI